MTALFLIFLDQICPKWIKLGQIGFLTNLKNVKRGECEEGGSVKRGECEEGGIVSGGTGLAGLIGLF